MTQGKKEKMKRLIVASLAFVLFFVLITSVHASVTIQAVIDQNVRAIEGTIVLEVPASLEDTLLNSPFLILGALIVVNIAAFVYRRVRK